MPDICYLGRLSQSSRTGEVDGSYLSAMGKCISRSPNFLLEMSPELVLLSSIVLRVKFSGNLVPTPNFSPSRQC
jgi:hypothetical protein